MANLAAWFAALIPTLVGRVMLALGFGVLTVAGIDAGWDALRDELYANLGAMPLSIIQLSGLSGAGDALAYIIGAISARIALYVATKGARIIGLPAA
mgnify:FL=1